MNYMNLRKALGFSAAVLFAALVGPFTALPALAGPTEDAPSKFYSQISMAETKLGGATGAGNGSAVSTTTVLLNLSYTGSAASAMVTITASSIAFYAPQGTLDTSIGGTVGTGGTGGAFDLTIASVATLGQLCDLINGAAGPYALNGSANGGAPSGSNYHCTLIGGIRSDSAANLLPAVTQAAGVNSLNAVGGYNVPVGTSTFMSIGIIPATGRHVVLNFCVANTTGTIGNMPSMQVFGVKAKYGALDLFGNQVNDSSLAWQGTAFAPGTTTTEPLHNTSGIVPDYAPWLEFNGGGSYSYALSNPPGKAPNPPTGPAYNGHVVIRVNDFAQGGVANTATNFLTCQWSEKLN